ncbi:MAG: hypothetical protein ACP5KY_02490 [Thermoproteus sp.]
MNPRRILAGVAVSVAAISVLLILLNVWAKQLVQYSASQAADYYATESFYGDVRFNNITEAQRYLGNFVSSMGNFLASRATAMLARSNVHYLSRSALRGTPLEALVNRTVAVVEGDGHLYAVVLPRGAPQPASSFEVYDVATGREVPSRTVVVASADSEYHIPLDRNATEVVKAGGRVYKVVIETAQPLDAVVLYSYYGVSWYWSGTWAASTYTAGYFAVNLGQGVADVLPAGWVDTNYNIVTVCQTNAPGTTYYSSSHRYAAVQTTSVHANYYCPGSTALVSYPWIAIDGVTGQWIYPTGLPGYKSWSPTYCVGGNIQVTLPPPSLPEG